MLIRLSPKAREHSHLMADFAAMPWIAAPHEIEMSGAVPLSTENQPAVFRLGDNRISTVVTIIGATIAMLLLKRTDNGGRARVRSIRSGSGDKGVHLCCQNFAAWVWRPFCFSVRAINLETAVDRLYSHEKPHEH